MRFPGKLFSCRLALGVALLGGAFLCRLASPATAQEESPRPPRISVSTPVEVQVWNRPIVALRATVDGVTPAERAARIEQRIEAISDRWLDADVVAHPAQVADLEGYLISVHGDILLGLVDEDLETDTESLDEVANATAARIENVLRARAEQRRLPLLVRALLATFGATAIFLLTVWGVSRLRAALLGWLHAQGSGKGVPVLGVNVYPYLSSLVGALVKIVAVVFVLNVAYLWATFVLMQFPYTQPWGESLGSQLSMLATRLGVGALEAVPGLFTVLVIFVLTRLFTRGVSSFFGAVETGRLEPPWLSADTARATRRLVVVLVWIFSVTVAYPYIPGAQTDAFKGVSVFVGLMVSLGGAGFVNQIMGGLVVVYARSFRVGDYISVGEKEGVVTDIGSLSTKIVTRSRQEITVPNAVLVGTTVTNYSKLDRAGGVGIAVTVTIGYDTPWRQVHALLKLAAERTPGLRKEPPVEVLQRSLSDFYVEYQLLARLEHAADRLPVLSALNASIQDAFNEFGVQIMSPHFERQPADKVVISKDLWHPAPAPKPDSSETSGES